MHDCVIAGGGPAGSTLGSLLARAGLSVLIVEKEKFPRFHIGESLLPCGMPILEELGIDMSEFQHKAGAVFEDEGSGKGTGFPFSMAMPGSPHHAYQVDRSRFDQLLLNRARSLGAKVHEQERLVDVHFSEDGVQATTDKGSYRSRYFVDATGQDAWFGRKSKTLIPIKGLGRAAVFQHFSGLSESGAKELGHAGNIKVLLIPDGWVWIIPLRERRVSIGLVRRKGTITPELLSQEIEGSAVLQRLTAGAVASEARIIRNFSYKNTASIGRRYACVGDAGCFLDPVFSSGVFLAMAGAKRLSELLVPAFAQQREHAPDLLRAYAQWTLEGYQVMGAMVNRFYNTALVNNLFFAAEPVAEIRAGIISILAGDLWRRDNPFQEMLRTSRRSIPPELRSKDLAPELTYPA